MGFVTRDFLKTQFANFATRLSDVFAKKEHQHVSILKTATNTKYGTKIYSSSVNEKNLTQINERFSITKTTPTYQWFTIATIEGGKPEGTRKLNIIKDDGGQQASVAGVACQITSAGEIQISSTNDLNHSYVTIIGGYGY